MNPVFIPALLLLSVLGGGEAFAFGDGHYFAVKEGNAHYRDGDYESAEKSYGRARTEKDSDVARYNLGNAFFRKGDYDKADEMYSTTLKSGNPEIAKKGLMNHANAKYRRGAANASTGQDPAGAAEDLKEAVFSYRKVLLKDPSSIPAKHNMELALEKLKELEEQRKKEEGDKKEDDGKQEGSGEKKEQEPSGEGKDREREDKAEARPREEPQGKIKPEDAERILKALSKNEENVQKQLRLNRRVEERPVEKDW